MLSRDHRGSMCRQDLCRAMITLTPGRHAHARFPGSRVWSCTPWALMCLVLQPSVPGCFFVALWLGLIITGASLLALAGVAGRHGTRTPFLQDRRCGEP